MCAFKLRDPEVHTISDIVCRNTRMEQEELLSDENEYRICHLDEAAALIRSYIEKRKPICIFGDYDVDGITSAAILSQAFSYARKRLQIRLPKRFSEGYGATASAIDEFRDGSLLILVDNGIVSFDAVKRAKEKKMQVIIIDHHLPMEDDGGNFILPDADVIIDPHVFPDEFNDYCGAGLCYRLVETLFNDKGFIPINAAILAAIGTICDSVPLVKENRRIVKQGLKFMEDCSYAVPCGLQELIRALELSGSITANSVAFRIGPCLNAPGRLYDTGAMKSLELIGTTRKTRREYRELALSIVNDNKLRKDLTEEWFAKLLDQIYTHGHENDYPVAEYMPGIPEGIVGILSGKISELLKTPSFIFTDSTETGLIKGSGRSYGDIHLKKLLDMHSDVIEKYGGHMSAAGITIRLENLDALKSMLSADLGAKTVCIEDTAYDLEVRTEDISSIMNELEKFGPYGNGNPEPVFLIKGVSVIPVGKEYYKELSSNGIKLITSGISAVTFNCRDKYLKMGAPQRINLVGTLSRNTFRRNTYIQMEFTDVEPSVSTAPVSSLQEKLKALSCSRYNQEAI